MWTVFAVKRFLLVAIALFAAAPAYADTIPIKISYSSPIAPEEFAIPTDFFQLSAGSRNISLNITTFSVDDRGVLLLNDAIIASTGIGGPGMGQMVLTEHGPSLPFNFEYGNNSSSFAPTLNLFVTGWNTLSLIVNNTTGGISGALSSIGSSSATLIGTVTFDVGPVPVPPPGPSEVPLPSALPLFATGLGALGLLGWHSKRKAQNSLS